MKFVTGFVVALAGIVFAAVGLLFIQTKYGPGPSSIEYGLRGVAEIVDGDGLIVEGQSIRLADIDAPELDQLCYSDAGPWPCGEQAAARLHQLISGQDVRCEWVQEDRYKRKLGTCEIYGSSVTLNEILVSEGLALAYRRLPSGARSGDQDIADPMNYVAIGTPTNSEIAEREEGARRARRGVWDSHFMTPASWRSKR